MAVGIKEEVAKIERKEKAKKDAEAVSKLGGQGSPMPYTISRPSYVSVAHHTYTHMHTHTHAHTPDLILPFSLPLSSSSKH